MVAFGLLPLAQGWFLLLPTTRRLSQRRRAGIIWGSKHAALPRVGTFGWLRRAHSRPHVCCNRQSHLPHGLSDKGRDCSILSRFTQLRRSHLPDVSRQVFRLASCLKQKMHIIFLPASRIRSCSTIVTNHRIKHSLNNGHAPNPIAYATINAIAVK